MKVNNEIITNININEEYRYLIALNTDLKSLKKEEIFNLAKNSFLREKIKENELKKYFELNQSSKYIDQTIKNLYGSLNISSKIEFKKYLSVHNLTIEDVKKKLEIEVLWNELIYTKFHKQIDIDEEKIQNNYLLSEIFFSGENKEKINEKYNLIKKSISEIGFKNTANIYSLTESSKIGGSIGWIGENQLTKKIVNEINKLQVGEFTKPIIIPGGLLILKLDEKADKKISLDFDSEFKKLIAYEKNRQLNQFSTIYFNKLKFNTKIDQ